MEQAWFEMKESISLANRINGTEDEVADFHLKLKASLGTAVTLCRTARKRKIEETPKLDISDRSILMAARFTDNLPLANYKAILHLVPRLVNIVTLAEAVPVSGSGLTLPLDLHAIGARCTNAYYAPKRFAAVQLAFSNPRCRVLVFRMLQAMSNHETNIPPTVDACIDTCGRYGEIGCSGPMAARMAIMKAARQLALEANVHVGAVGIDAKLNCDAFASTHSATSHYDRASFVGLAWRPGGEQICCEIYSTGKANLPGSTRQRDLLMSFSRMISELLRHSDRPEVCDLVPEHLRLCHRPKSVTRDDAPVVAQSKTTGTSVPKMSDLFVDDTEWNLGPLGPVDTLANDTDTAAGDDLLELAGF